MKHLLTFLFLALNLMAAGQTKGIEVINWGKKILVHNEPVTKDSLVTIEPGLPGIKKSDAASSNYCRLLKLKDGSWIAGYTISRNKSYRKNNQGGLEIQFAKSGDDCRTWVTIGILSEPGRDLDNVQLIELSEGSILMSCRSVRWQESYIIPVYKSTDGGINWKKFSIIDEINGKPGELGNPNKGLYEPHFYFLGDGRLAVMYANEKHVVESPAYSQVVSERVSPDLGKTWGTEILAVHTPGKKASRPGMSVWTKMNNGKYIVVYEICGPEACNVYYKISDNGMDWPVGPGDNIPDQHNAPYVLALENGTLVVTSNSSQMSISNDYGKTWKTVPPAWDKTFWPSLYEIRQNEIGAVNSFPRKEGGNNIQIRLGNVE